MRRDCRSMPREAAPRLLREPWVPNPQLRRPSVRRLLPLLAAVAACMALSATHVRAEKMVLRDGRELEGTFSPVASLQGERGAKNDELKIDHIYSCDTGLKRIFVPQRRIRTFMQGQGAPAPEEFRLKQRSIGSRGIVNNVTTVLKVTPFDEFGRRTFSIASPQGGVDVIQGISRITPAWTRIDALNYTWDMRVATNSIPREALNKVLSKVIDRTNETHRRQYVQFLIQAQRYGEAEREITELIKDFPALRDRMLPVAKSLLQLQARQILTEIELRREAKQFALVKAMIQQFPVDGVGGEILQTVRTMQEDYEKEVARTVVARERFDAELAKVPTDTRRQLLPIRDEIFARRAFLVREDFDPVRFGSTVAEEWQQFNTDGRNRALLPGPGRRLLLKLSDAGRNACTAIAMKGEASDDDARTVLLALNDLLGVPDFYAEEDFAAVVLTEELKELLTRPRNTLQIQELRRLNRGLLEAAYPDAIVPGRWGGLGLTTLPRIEPFLQFSEDPALSAQEKLALAVNGWLLGPNFTKTNLPTALSLWRIRQLVHDYLNSKTIVERSRLIEQLQAQEGSSAENVAKLLAHMPPPVDTPIQEVPGFFELSAPGMPGDPEVTYFVQLPPEYDPYHLYPTIVTLHGSGTVAAHSIRGLPIGPAAPAAGPKPSESPTKNPAKKPFDDLLGGPAEKEEGTNRPIPTPAELARRFPSQIDWWAGAPDERGVRNGQSMRHGYIVIAPVWDLPGQKGYGYSGREHAAVLNTLRDACRRFSVDADRVFLQGHDTGGDAAWDLGLAHPDLWAGVIPTVGTAGKYSAKYWGNAKLLSTYHLAGELDADSVLANGREYDRFMIGGFDTTVVEYRGRGHEHFMEDQLDLFDWMKRRTRDFYPPEFECMTLRPWDNYFWWVEVRGLPAKSIVEPFDWDTRGKTAPAVPVTGSRKLNNSLHVRTGASDGTIWLSPRLVEFDKRIEIKFNGKMVVNRQFVEPSLAVMLEDARTRADRLRPFWAKVDTR